MTTTKIPARQGGHASLRRGQRLKILQPDGPQVVDTWAFGLRDEAFIYLSMSHTRASLQKLSPSIGDFLRSSDRQPILTLVEDTTSGVHDMLFAACDRTRYDQYGVKGYHASCADNLLKQMQNFGLVQTGEGMPLRTALMSGDWTPDPLNLFMNIPVKEMRDGEGGGIGIEAPTCKSGDYVVLRAEVDCIVVMSACPMDLNDVNGGVNRAIAFKILD